MFVMLTLPWIGVPNRLPLWFKVLVISRDVAIIATVAVVNLAIGPRTFRPSIYGKIATRALHRHPAWPRCTSITAARPSMLVRDADLGVAGDHLRLSWTLRGPGLTDGPLGQDETARPRVVAIVVTIEHSMRQN